MSKYKDIIIACDMDDTIERLKDAWITYLNNRYGYSVKYQDIVDWNITLAFPGLTDAQVFEPLDCEEFWKTVEPMKDAQKYIPKLIEEGFQIYIVTSASPRSVAPKLEHVLYKYFPYIDSHNVIIARKKQMIRCDILIDDAEHNVVGPYIGLLKDTPHNQKFNTLEHQNTFRVHCWKHIYETIHKLVD